MRKQGHISRWNGPRGFGFIRSADTPAEVYFHVRDFSGTAPPAEGMPVVFEEIHVGGKGPRAMAVRPLAAPPSTPASSRSGLARPRAARSAPSRPDRTPRASADRRPPRSTGRPAAPGSTLAYGLMAVWAAALLWLVYARYLPGWTLAAAAAINVVTLAAYALDKQAARTGSWRTSEQRLHLLALAGGWPGAWVAQQWLRHKSSKPSFRTVYWATVVVHCAALALAVYRLKA